MVFGAAIIATGIYLQLNNSNEKDQQTLEPEEEIITFQPLNPHNLETTCQTYNKISTYIYTASYQKITFEYPDCVHEYDLSSWHKSLKNESDDISVRISKEKNTINNYLNSKKTTIISQKNDGTYDNVEYSEITNITTDNGIDASFLEYTYQYNLISSSTTYDIWYIATNIDENTILTYEITSKNKIMSYDTIIDTFLNVQVETIETLINSTIEGEYQFGTIKQNMTGSYEHGYKLNYQIPTKYPEVDSIGTGYDNSVFQYEDINQEIYVSLELISETYDSLEETTERFRKASANSYPNTENYRNFQDTGVLEKNINGKNVYYFVQSYDYYLENKKTDNCYKSYVYYEIAPNFYLRIHISNENVEINEAFISIFLNFTIEEY